MPTPSKSESHGHYIGRCVPFVMRERGTKGSSHAVAKCEGMWRQHLRVHNARRLSTTRTDPTRTGMLRAKFMRAMDIRFRSLKADIKRLIVDEDAFGLREPIAKPLIIHTRWKFNTKSEQTEAFRQWLQMQVNEKVLESVDPNRPTNVWLQQYIEESYRKGQGRAFDDAMQRYKEKNQERPDWYAGTREEFLRSSFGRPVSVERVAQLTSRVYSDLKGVTDAMSTVMQRTLMDGMIQGKSPRDVARDLNKSVDGIGIARARTIARTETIRAHADGQLDALKQLGVEEVGVMVEWSTAGDDLVCPLCADLNGIVMKINEAYAIIPRHPNCRCSWIPANVGEPTKDQVRGKPSIERSIEQSLKKEHPKADSAEEARKLSRWAGADKEIGARRPAPKVTPEGAAVPKPKPKLKSITLPKLKPVDIPKPMTPPEPVVLPTPDPSLSDLLTRPTPEAVRSAPRVDIDIRDVKKGDVLTISQDGKIWKRNVEVLDVKDNYIVLDNHGMSFRMYHSEGRAKGLTKSVASVIDETSKASTESAKRIAEWKKSLDKKDRDLLSTFTGADNNIRTDWGNRALEKVREAQINGTTNPELQKWNSIFARSPGYDGNIYRGVRMSDLKDDTWVGKTLPTFEQFSSKIEIGGTIELPYDSSFSRSSKVAASFSENDSYVFVTKSSKNISIEHLASDYAYQKEILVQKGSKFKISEVKDVLMQTSEGQFKEVKLVKLEELL